MDIEVRLEMHNQIMWYLDLHVLVVEWYCVQNWRIPLSTHRSVAPSFAESVAVLRLVI